jgi:hypothetical protein
MKTNFKRSLATCAVALAAAGCASFAVSNEAIETNTAQSLGLQKGSFIVSDRVDEGVKSSYAVKTNKGRTYSCYVTGGVSVMGRVVSDAICSDTTASAKGSVQPAAPQPQKDCNALLKAAGRCS